VDERDRRIACVGELPDSEDAFRLSGLFDVHWEAREGKTHGDGPVGVSVDEAIAWGREHASYVSVRIGDRDTFYSAGERDLAELGDDDDDGEPDEPWPGEGMVIRARPIGAPLDGSIQEVDWLTESESSDLPGCTDDDLERLRAALAMAGRLRAVEVTRRTYPPGLRVRCTVKAWGGGPAVIGALRLVDAALAEVVGGHTVSTSCLGPADDSA
jgi:hypothetical protein